MPPTHTMDLIKDLGTPQITILTKVTAMLTRTSIEIAPALRLLWLASPALPIGAYAYSEGLEAAVEQGLVHDAQSAADWLSQQMKLWSRGDLAVMAAAIPAWRRDDQDELTRIASWLHVTRDSAEARLQSEQMGQSLRLWLREQDPASELRLSRFQSPAYALVMSLALSTIDTSLIHALQTHGFAWAENQVQAALKAVPLGQNAGQRVLACLAGQIPAVVEVALHTPIGAAQVFAPRLAILAARHETQYSRLFRS